MTRTTDNRPSTLGALAPPAGAAGRSRRSCAPTCSPGSARARPIFPGVVGYDETVLPAVENAILAGQDLVFLGERGQAKTRHGPAARRPARRVAAGRRRRRAQRRPDRARSARPPARLVAEHGDETPIDWLPRDRRYAEKLATPDITIADLIGEVDPDPGRRGPLPHRRADPPLRAHPARQPRDLRDQRAARPRRADPGRPAQHPRGARRPDPRLHRPPAARPVRRRQRRTRRTTPAAAGSSRRSRTASGRRSGPTTRGRSTTRSRSCARRSCASRTARRRRSSCPRSWRSSSPS